MKLYTVIILLALLFPQQGYAQAQAEVSKEPALLVVRFIAVAKPPRVRAGIDNQRGSLLDEAAIPPQNLTLKVGKTKVMKLSLILNVPSRNFLLKKPRAVVLEADGKSVDNDKPRPFLDLILPAEQGVFTIVITRKPGQKSWENPTVNILQDLTDNTQGKTRFINLSNQSIGFELGSAKRVIKPLDSLAMSSKTKSKHSNARLFTKQNNQWVKLLVIGSKPRVGIIQTVICYHERPNNNKITTLTCHQRIESVARIREKVISMDKLVKKP